MLPVLPPTNQTCLATKLGEGWILTSDRKRLLENHNIHASYVKPVRRWTWRDFVFKCRTILYFLRQLLGRQIWFVGGKTRNIATQPVLQQFYKNSFTIGHFRVPKILSFKTRLTAKTILVKITIIILMSMALHSALHWNRDLGQLWNGLFRPFYRTFKADTHSADFAPGACSRLILHVSVHTKERFQVRSICSRRLLPNI